MFLCISAAVWLALVAPRARAMFAASAWGFSNATGQPGWTNLEFEDGNLTAVAASAAAGAPGLYPWTGWAVPRPGHEHVPCVSKIKRYGKPLLVRLSGGADH